MPDSLHILPAGGFSREVALIARDLAYERLDFYDDQPQGGIKDMADLPDHGHIALAIGSSQERRKLHQRLEGGPYVFPNLIASQASLLDQAKTQLGQGTIIAAGAILTTEIEIGDFALINLHCSIGHNCRLGHFVSLMPGVRLSGGVTIEDEVYLGTNATVLPGLHIGRGATIGAGAVITKNVPAGETWVGVPGKRI